MPPSRWLKGCRLSRSSSSTSSHDPTSPSNLSSFSDDVGTFIKPSDPPTLSSLFTSAAEFHNILTSSHCIDSQSSETSDSEGSCGFTNLVGVDLDSSEHAAAANIARLRAARYSWGSDNRPLAEQESSDQEEKLDDELFEGDETFLESPTTTPEVEETDSEKLEPAQIIDILVKEFGPLASDQETESLIIESDGCMSAQDVFIVVWLTCFSLVTWISGLLHLCYRALFMSQHTA